MQPITTTSELAAVCRRMASEPFITVDTEFLRETTYYPLLCVAQMASADEAVVIDALALRHRPRAVLRAHGRRKGDEGLSRRAPGHRDCLASRQPHLHVRFSIRRSRPWCLATATPSSFDQLVQHITGDTLDDRTASPFDATPAVGCAAFLRGFRRYPFAPSLRTRWSTISVGAASSTRCRRRCTCSPPPIPTHGSGSAWRPLKTRVRRPRELGVLIEVAAWGASAKRKRAMFRARGC